MATTQVFHMDTKRTSYIVKVTETGHLEQLYYGKKLRKMMDYTPLEQKRVIGRGNSVMYNKEQANFCLDDARLEYATPGKGDLREVACEVWSEKSGAVTDFIYHSSKWSKGREVPTGMPYARGDATNCETLEIVLIDAFLKLKLILAYHIFERTDVITRHVKLINEGEDTVQVRRLMSMQLDLPQQGYELVTFSGTWVREMTMSVKTLTPGVYIQDAKTGTSSNRHNPLILLKAPNCTEDTGGCYGFNLIYSGNHAEIVEVSPFDTVRILSGINPYLLDYQLQPQATFESPEAVMTYTSEGMNRLSQQFHEFIHEHIIPDAHRYKERPVLINNWEATYFDFTEKKLMKLAKSAAELGVELFVLDDGWFGERNDDKTSLGDWYVNDKKLPNGIEGLCSKINDLGMQFGLWVEPEMVSVQSKLYEAHPDWALQVPGRTASEGRNQLVLDLAKEEVRNYLVERLSSIFSSCNISYVKWDMNRHFSDMYSTTLQGGRQGELFHRYTLGLYDILERLTKRFPNILFEGCSSGGNRFDLGMLYYMPQIWSSDNTDANERVRIQRGLSYGYPLGTMGAHVSNCPNHQTLRNTSLDTRYNVAAFGLLGYEMALGDLGQLEKKAIKEQIAFYKKYRKLFQFGTLYRLISDKGHQVRQMVVSQDKEQAILIDYQMNQTSNGNLDYLQTRGLDDTLCYQVETRQQKLSVKVFGDLINKALPVHIKKDGLVHHVVSGVYELDAEKETYTCYGDLLNYAGICLNEQFNGTDYHGQVRVMGDFASRLYTFQAVDVT